MSASDVVVVVLAVVVAGLAGVVASVLISLRRSLRALHVALDELRSDTLPLVEELTAAVDTTVYSVDRVDRLITSAETIEARVDSASRLAYRTISNPMVKALAAGSGVKRSWRRLRGKPIDETRAAPRRRARRKAS